MHKSTQRAEHNYSIINYFVIEYPDFWTPFDQSDGGFKMVQIRIDSEEYRFVASTFETTIPPTKKKIQRIERIQNELLWSKYYDCTKRMHDHNDGVTNEMCLFHGTRALNPEDIYKGDAGFDMRFSNQGMWGNGNYFAVKASYSDSGYAYRCADGCSQILMASVLTGHQHTCQPDSSLRKPAVRDDSGPIKRRYDSVSGDTGGSKVFITYENDRAYPSYLITYK